MTSSSFYTDGDPNTGVEVAGPSSAAFYADPVAAANSATQAAASATAAAASAAQAATAVQSAAGTATPIVDGAAAVGTSAQWSHEDHVHPTDTSRAAVSDLALKAPLASPALTGAPTAPTAAVGTDTTQLATTAFANAAVQAKGGAATPLGAGTAAVGTSNLWSHEDHVHPTDTSRAPLTSPAFTGAPTAPTPSAGDSTTKLATTAFVSNAMSSVSSFVLPGGRLTLTSGVPVMTTSVANAGSVYYSAYAGNQVPLWNGTAFIPTAIPGNEISLLLSDATKSPAAAVPSGIYDVYVWNDAGTIRLSRGPNWPSQTARAGSDLTLVNGVYLNTAAITNGPAALRGTYVGTIGTNGSANCDYIFPAFSVSGTSGVFLVWNCYNRVDVTGVVGLTAGSWTYAVANTWRAQNGSATCRIYMLRGLNDDAVSSVLSAQAAAGTSMNAAVGIGIDSTTAPSGRPMYEQSTTPTPLTAYYDGYPGVGVHSAAALEYNSGATASTFYGNPVSYIQTGLSARFRA